MRKLRHKKISSPAQGCTAHKAEFRLLSYVPVYSPLKKPAGLQPVTQFEQLAESDLNC